MASDGKERFQFIRSGPLTIAVIYLIVGLLWIVFSDTIVYSLAGRNSQFLLFSTIKGFAFVLVTAVLLYGMILFSSREIMKEQERYRTLAENSRDMIFHLSLPDRQFLYVSPSSYDVSGYAPEEFYNDPALIAKIIHPAWQGSFQEIWAKLPAGEIPPVFEYQIIDKSGKTRWVNQRNTIIRNSDNRPVAMDGAVTDITDRKKAEEGLQRSEEKYRNLVENTLDILYSVDENGRITYVSPQVVPLLGFSPEELVRTGFLPFIHPEDRERILTNFKNEMATGDNISSTFRILDKSGSIHWVENRSHILFDGQKKPAGQQGVLRDVTDRKRAEEQIRLTDRKLSLMTEVTYQDIKNKVTAAMGFIALDQQATGAQVNTSLHEKAMEALTAIQTLIAKTKEYQKIGMDKSQWLSLEKTIRMQFSNLSSTQGISLDCHLPGLEVYADPLIERVFYNLMHNSISHGKTTTRISFSGKETADGLVVIYEDNGIGISHEIKPHIFERFVGGGGKFHLFFVREFLSLSNMSITETGLPGKGARFEITIPKGLYRYSGSS